MIILIYHKILNNLNNLDYLSNYLQNIFNKIHHLNQNTHLVLFRDNIKQIKFFFNKIIKILLLKILRTERNKILYFDFKI